MIIAPTHAVTTYLSSIHDMGLGWGSSVIIGIVFALSRCYNCQVMLNASFHIQSSI